MPDIEEKDQETEPTEGQEGGTDDGTDEKSFEEILKDNPLFKKAFEDAQQVEGDRRVEQAMKKQRKDEDSRIKQAKEDAKREAREKKLLEDGKQDELIEELRTQKQESENALQDYLKKDQVNKLLDNKKVLDPETREFYHKVNVSIEELSEFIDGFQAVNEKNTKEVVDERLVTKQPPKGKARDTGNLEGKSYSEQVAELTAQISKTEDTAKQSVLRQKIRVLKYTMTDEVNASKRK